VLLLTSFYLVMPLVRITFPACSAGGTIATVLWEITRGVGLVYSVVSSVNLIYGSFATSVVALISIEAIAVIVLLGAQVIAEVERRNSSGRHSTGPERGGVRSGWPALATGSVRAGGADVRRPQGLRLRTELSKEFANKKPGRVATIDAPARARS